MTTDLFSWMAWTLPTAVFFLLIITMLIVMVIISIWKPSTARKGLLPIATTRGDRLYVGLMGTAFINFLWLGMTDLSQWGAVIISLAWLFFILRWG